MIGSVVSICLDVVSGMVEIGGVENTSELLPNIWLIMSFSSCSGKAVFCCDSAADTSKLNTQTVLSAPIMVLANRERVKETKRKRKRKRKHGVKMVKGCSNKVFEITKRGPFIELL